MENTEIYPDQLQAAGNELGRVAQDLGTRFQRLVGEVGALAAPWGNDEIGMLIGESYTAVQELAQETITSIVTSLEDFGTGLIDFAEAARRTDEDLARTFQQLGRQLNGHDNSR